MIRLAEDGDADAVAALINAINSLDGPAPALPMTADVVRRDLIGARARAKLLVAVHDGRVVGFATAGAIYDAERQADALMLLDLYVMPGSRRRGLARQVQAHGDRALARGVEPVEVQRLVGLVGAQRERQCGRRRRQRRRGPPEPVAPLHASTSCTRARRRASRWRNCTPSST